MALHGVLVADTASTFLHGMQSLEQTSTLIGTPRRMLTFVGGVLVRKSSPMTGRCEETGTSQPGHVQFWSTARPVQARPSFLETMSFLIVLTHLPNHCRGGMVKSAGCCQVMLPNDLTPEFSEVPITMRAPESMTLPDGAVACKQTLASGWNWD